MWFSFFITWEQRKLKQVATIQKGEQLSKAKLDSVGKYYVLNGGMEPSGFCDEYNTEPNTISISEGGNSCGYVALNLDRFWSGGHNYTLQNLRIDTEFLFQCLKGIEMKIMALRVGSGLPNIQKAAIDGVDIIFPLEDEQKSIGQFLTKLSNLITLHQRKQNGLFLLILGKKSSLILANDWEQRKFGEYFEERNERSGEGELISVTINSGIKKFNELGRFDSKPEDLSKYKRVEVGDIAYNSMRMWQGASGYSPYAGILSPAYTVITPKNGISSLFFAYLIKRPPMIHLFEINSQGLTSDTWNLKFPAFSQIEASAPFSVEEQDRIAELFGILDNLITLHQCKEILIHNEYDSSSLFRLQYKMANAWEQRKLGDIFERIVRKNVNNESSLPLTISAQGGLVDQITYFNNRVASRDVSNYYLVLNGEFAYNKSTSDGYPYGAVKRLDLYEKGVLSTLYIVFALKDDAKTDSDYMAVFFDTNRWHRGVAERAAEGARNHGLLNISAEDFFDIGISLPGSIDEQRKIGRILKRIDNLITLHQCKRVAFMSRKSSSIFRFEKWRNTLTWEQRKLKQVATIQKGEQLSKAKLDSVGKYYVLNGGMEPSGFCDEYNTEPNTISISEGGNSCGYVALNLDRFWSGGHNYTLQNLRIDTEFLFQCLKGIEMKIMALRVGSGLPNIQKAAIDGVDIIFPLEDEQKSIGQFLTKLSNLITLHQRGEKIYNRRQTW